MLQPAPHLMNATGGSIKRIDHFINFFDSSFHRNAICQIAIGVQRSSGRRFFREVRWSCHSAYFLTEVSERFYSFL